MGKLVPKLYDLIMAPIEKKRFKRVRSELLSYADGHVLEIGSGTGVNFPLYQNVKSVTAVEPDETMKNRSMEKITHSKVPIEVQLAYAENLPFDDHQFDSVVVTLALCTIQDVNQALSEMRRVVTPGGQVMFFEHVKLNDSTVGKLQDLLTPVWKKVAGGCHLNRDSLTLIKEAGFEVTDVDHMYKGLFLVIKAKNP
ncbi:ubiquinone/menaquinone biosynthesis C-methylase UbiE [Alkalibacillus filiformis]|uniref:Ubiquinone/menaquinone biosynthesis C-methylase UbiE n=1 Tax=Alkalibacillus filiformis TaxID=200990 RepID=A0ABU0DSM7_9BACI|nr:class I SAM-dependent methyltransferase [Alkalibacillus filiformis]MDQ0351432.1 ubiquinone/menaquinone biosynthesis C-methylase UbiE [Alkalibacillus filiformis]